MIKIAIVGPESSGKSTLAQQLAMHFQTSFAREIAREYLEVKQGPYDQSDLIEMAQLQLKEQQIAIAKSNKVCFFDTNILNFLIWSDVKYGKLSKELIDLWIPEYFDLTLLCYPDLPYETDPLREHPSVEDRKQLFRIHEAKLMEYRSKYAIIRRSGDERKKCAIEAILKTFPLKGYH